MAQTKRDIQAILSAAGLHPRHRFGQNFMIDQNLLRLVADAGEIAPGDRVIEVGPGTGTLTEELLARGAQVFAVEIDHDLAALLRGKFADEPRFSLIEGDALAGKHEINEELAAVLAAGPAKLVANLPYNIASPLIIELLLAGSPVLAFTVQKEVAHRLAAAPGGGEYGVLSVMAQLLADVEILRTLPSQAFWPRPKIESALVRMRRHDRLGGQARAFSQFMHRVFSSRRKTLRNALARASWTGSMDLWPPGLPEDVRPEGVSPEQFLQLVDGL